ncbi:DNA gyrase subunit A [Candidatus Woesearchaeota archaeon]|nr:DNA gyrase subunit A [Candidatus Woesearchaeota archaeon]
MAEAAKQENTGKQSFPSARNVRISEHAEQILPREIEDEMRQSYLDYAMSVIVGRALPDARDGLKPVHRRILYGMYDLGMFHNKPFKKSARIVGEILGKYHPHGDTAVYDALVRMAQDFSLRYPLIDGQGNFGSVDGDSPAAMRYTECRLTKAAEELLQDIDKETVAFSPNFDGSLEEPVVLPAKLPNLLINGSSGIAVGMATNVPPHNVAEICEGVIALIDKPELNVQELMQLVKGPDFPTGATIAGRNGIQAAYTHGRGKIIVKSRVKTEKVKNREQLIVEEIPYMVNKAQLIEQIADLVNHKVIAGITDIRDESDRDGMRIVLELKTGAHADVVLNQLYKHTRMEESFGIIMLALVDGQPKILGLKALLHEFVKHRQTVVRKRTSFDLDKAEKRAHLLEGLLIALKNIDEVIKLIKKSKAVEDARNTLITRFMLSVEQSTAILEMRLQRLTSLEQEKILEEHRALLKTIAELKAVLASEQKILGIIKREMKEAKEIYGDSRKTVISGEEIELEMEDLIANEENVITISNDGYIKRLQVDVYKKQRRGGRGVIAATTKEEDTIRYLLTTNTHNYLLFFTNTGRVYWLKAWQVPEAGRQAKGTAIVNLLQMGKDERIATLLAIKDFNKGFLVFATKKGVIKKAAVELFANPRKTGIAAISLDADDALVNVELTDGSQQLVIATAQGQAIKFQEQDVRSMGRSAAGVIGIKLRKNDYVIGMEPADDSKTLLTITEHGYGKRSEISDYRLISRGGSGVINIICSERNGKVVEIKAADDNDEILLISRKGIAIRIMAKDISVIGRNTQGVRLMKLEEGDTLVAATKILKEQNGLSVPLNLS